MREGEILAGKYVVERVLGQGGMGVVVAARHMGLHERVAVKFLLPHVLGQAEAIGRFLREARAAVRIKSEHVARVTDVGQLDSGAPYMVMEYLDGCDLAALLRAQRALSIADAVDYVIQACEAIADAHALGIIHRDLKPSNLMLVHRSDGSPCIKVLDFGISKVISPDSGLSMTQTSAVLGSPLYMSPEQLMSSRGVDERTDVWSLGVILYELVVGNPPFVAETQAGLGMLIATEEARPLRAHRPDAPGGLEAVMARCLAKRREARYGNVAELAQALAPFAPARSRESVERSSRILRAVGASERAEPISSSSARPGAGTLTAPAIANGSGSKPGPSRRTKIVALAGGGLVAAAATASFFVLRAPAGPAGDARPTPDLPVPPSATSRAPFEVPPAIVSLSAAPGREAPAVTAAATPMASAASPAAAAPVPARSLAHNPGASGRMSPTARGKDAGASPAGSAANPTPSSTRSHYEDM